ncbi:hypothetical protein [Candidatus Uabimicrobium amorphum]|uniref:Uncharacterized protein n=1 Tax=Uabimicrobium amorphum TaxID=2596890 RepID=A0A5S9F2E1_UABAM|nr:hypothetical protein [Candidatus Uabimicrobium amorphum]BBM83372.1 hypothetical protein UABAM_01724 [Candidatus Uabimicrobium amorphum]
MLDEKFKKRINPLLLQEIIERIEENKTVTFGETKKQRIEKAMVLFMTILLYSGLAALVYYFKTILIDNSIVTTNTIYLMVFGIPLADVIIVFFYVLRTKDKYGIVMSKEGLRCISQQKWQPWNRIRSVKMSSTQSVQLSKGFISIHTDDISPLRVSSNIDPFHLLAVIDHFCDNDIEEDISTILDTLINLKPVLTF